MVECKCVETLFMTRDEYTGRAVEKRVVPRYHSCEYVKKRTALIPEATARANVSYSRLQSGGQWSHEFSRIMDELVREKMAKGEM